MICTLLVATFLAAVCSAGPAQDYTAVGPGYCDKGYIGGWVAADAKSLEACKNKCDAEHDCMFFSLSKGRTCSRYNWSAGECVRKSGRGTYVTYKKTCSKPGSTVVAYWDEGACGPKGNDHNWGWCDHTKGNCKPTVVTDQCPNGIATLVKKYGTGQKDSYTKDGCSYRYFAEYQCSGCSIIGGDGWLQLGDWRIGQVDGLNKNGHSHFSICFRRGVNRTPQIFRSDGSNNQQSWRKRNDFCNWDKPLLQKPINVVFGVDYIQFGGWRLGLYDSSHLSVAYNPDVPAAVGGGKHTAMIWRADGTRHPGPRSDYNPWNKISPASSNIKYGQRFLQIGNFRIGDVEDNHCSLGHFSVSNFATDKTAVLYTGKADIHQGPRKPFSGAFRGKICGTAANPSQAIVKFAGEWMLKTSNNDGISIKLTVQVTDTRGKKLGVEDTKDISVSTGAKVGYTPSGAGGVTAETHIEVSAGLARSIAKSTTESIARSRSTTFDAQCAPDKKKRRTYIYQWLVRSSTADGNQGPIDFTAHFLCTTSYPKCPLGACANFDCSVCNGEPSHAPTPEPSPAPTHEPSPAPTHAPSPAPTHAPTPTPTHAPTPAPTHAPSPTPTHQPSPTPTPAPTHAPPPTCKYGRSVAGSLESVHAPAAASTETLSLGEVEPLIAPAEANTETTLSDGEAEPLIARSDDGEQSLIAPLDSDDEAESLIAPLESSESADELN